jgi:osmotically-inducible protein OsmY
MEKHWNAAGSGRIVTRRAVAAALAAALACAACGSQDQDRAKQVADDALIAAQVRAKAAAIDPATVSLVNVTCDRGNVTLTGKVATTTERTSIEQAARGVNGVQTVVDGITVDPTVPTGAQIEADLALAARINVALAAQTGVNAARVHVDVHRGVVTLTGSLPSKAHREVADETVRAVPGVKHVDDKLTIASK